MFAGLWGLSRGFGIWTAFCLGLGLWVSGALGKVVVGSGVQGSRCLWGLGGASGSGTMGLGLRALRV